MGKALVIKGLIVTNPIKNVTFDVQVSSISINKSSLSIEIGENDTLTAVVETIDGTPAIASFSSSNSSVASISQTGNSCEITALTEGSCTITATAGGFSASCSIEVKRTSKSVLATFYAKNTTILPSEKTALNSLVDGMLQAGLMDKMKYVYPLLGGNVDDMLIEAISPNNDDIASGVTTDGLSVISRTLVVTSRTNEYEFTLGSRGTALTPSNISFVSASNHPSGFGSGVSVTSILLTTSNNAINGLNVANGGYKYPSYFYGKSANVSVPSSSTDAGTGVSLTKRILIGTTFGGNSTIYMNGEKYRECSESPGTVSYVKLNSFLSNANSQPANFGFLAIGSGLSQSESATLSTLIDTFLTAIGK